MRAIGLIRLKALLLFTTLVTAYAAMALHAHPEIYYLSIEQSQHRDASPDLFDNCPICNFHLSSYIRGAEWSPNNQFLLLETFLPTTQTAEAIEHPAEVFLRGPPARA